MRNLRCAVCQFARDCRYARQIRNEWYIDRARPAPRLEEGCVLSRENLEGLIRDRLGCPVAFEAFVLDYKANCTIAWDVADSNQIQGWASIFVKGWDRDLKLAACLQRQDVIIENMIYFAKIYLASVAKDDPRARVEIALMRYFFKSTGDAFLDAEFYRCLAGNPIAQAIWDDMSARITREKVQKYVLAPRENAGRNLIAGTFAIDKFFPYLLSIPGDNPEVREKIRQFYEEIESNVNFASFVDQAELCSIAGRNPVVGPILVDMRMIQSK